MSLKAKKISLLAISVLLMLTSTACNLARQEGHEYIEQNELGMSSSMHTNKSSEEYPHTRALMEQPTRYIYYDVDLIEQHPEGRIPIEFPFDLSFELPFSDHIDWKGPDRGKREGDRPPKQAPGKPDRPNKERPSEQPATPQQPTEQPAQPNQPEAPQQPTEQPQQPAQPDRPTQHPEQPEQPTQQPGEEPGISATEMQVIELTNARRREAGLPDLQADAHLTQVAREKSSDMQRNRYFSHTSPTYGSPFDMMRDMGVTYRAAGENIAMGQRSPQEVVQAWMDSQGHRENILNSSYTHIGVGYVENGHYWTQMFISK